MDDDVPAGAELREWLDSDTPENRARLAECFASLGPDDTFVVLREVLWAEEARRERHSMVAYLTAQIALPALLFVLLAGGWPIPIPVAFLLSLLGPPFIAGQMYAATPAPPRERHVLERLAQMSDVRVTYHLLTSRNRLRPGDPLRKSVDDALARLLPRLTPETAGVLSSQFDHVWQGLGDSVVRAAEGRPRESPGLNRAILRSFGNARPPLARSVLTSVADAKAPRTADPDAETLRRIAANYLVAWDTLEADASEAASTTVPAVAAETAALLRRVS